MKTRISKKALAAMPTAVAEEVQWMASRYSIKSFSLSTVPATMRHAGQPAYGLYLSEGSTYSIVYRGQVMSAQMVSESTMGATGVSYDVGKTAPIPVDAVIIEVWYYAGYGMRIVTVTPPALTMSTIPA